MLAKSQNHLSRYPKPSGDRKLHRYGPNGIMSNIAMPTLIINFNNVRVILYVNLNQIVYPPQIPVSIVYLTARVIRES